jgi:hypothetical protein
VADRVGSCVAEKLLQLGSLAWSLIVKLPQRLWWIALDVWHAVTSLLGWMRAGLTGTENTTMRSWLRASLLGALARIGRLLLHLVELAGLDEVVQLLWGLIFRLRPLNVQELVASASVRPAGLISYWQVRMHDDSALIKIGVMLTRLLNTKVSPGAITSMHIVHAPAAGLGMPLVVHELTSKCQPQHDRTGHP